MRIVFWSFMMLVLGSIGYLAQAKPPAHNQPVPLEKKITTEAPSSHKVDALLVSCVDYRLTDDIHKAMVERGLAERYDHLTLAGAALGASNDFFPHWQDAFWSHLALLVNIHNIQSVILLDHRDCGMYDFVYNDKLFPQPSKERETHLVNLKKLKEEILKKYPQLKVKIWLMALDGTIEDLT